MGNLHAFYSACQTFADLLRDRYALESTLTVAQAPEEEIVTRRNRLLEVKNRQRQQRNVIIALIPDIAASVGDAGKDPNLIFALEHDVESADASFYEKWAAARPMLKSMLQADT